MLSKSNGYTFGVKTGSALDNSKNCGLPGPGSYTLASAIGLKYNTNKGGFGTSKRNMNSKSFGEIPGPG